MRGIIVPSFDRKKVENGKSHDHRVMNSYFRFKFDDDRVVPVTEKEALEDNYGGEQNKGTKVLKRFTNAYMLVYVRNSDIDWILSPVSEDDIPQHLREFHFFQIKPQRAAFGP
jgi:hypothetical protein